MKLTNVVLNDFVFAKNTIFAELPIRGAKIFQKIQQSGKAHYMVLKPLLSNLHAAVIPGLSIPLGGNPVNLVDSLRQIWYS